MLDHNTHYSDRGTPKLHDNPHTHDVYWDELGPHLSLSYTHFSVDFLLYVLSSEISEGIFRRHCALYGLYISPAVSGRLFLLIKAIFLLHHRRKRVGTPKNIT